MRKKAGGVAAPRGGSISQSLEIRPIENGFIARHSSTGADGEYHSKEVFHPKEPKLEFSPQEAERKALRQALPQNGLQQAKRALEDRPRPKAKRGMF